MDELISYHNLPSSLTERLKGYQAFRKLGVEFTNIHNNRQQCSASRASFLTGEINTGIQDDIDQSYQYEYVPAIASEFDTIAKVYKRNDSSYKTAYFGKTHTISALATTDFELPQLDVNTRGAMKKYGFDTYSTFGDAFYSSSEGIFNDNRELECIIPQNCTEYDYLDPDTGKKYNGIIPFLKARLGDGAKFHAQYHIMNPHDTSEFIQNFSTYTTASRRHTQFYAPYLAEQVAESGNPNPYYYDATFPDAYVKHKNLTTNYFERTYERYKTIKDTLPYLASYNADYVTDPANNSIFPWYVAMQVGFGNSLTIADDASDIASWKNLVNNYYGLVIEADTYVYTVYKFMQQNNLLDKVSVVIMADHGDQMSAHGLKQKGFPFKESTNVPFIVCSPFFESKLKGTKSGMLGSLIDLNPTIEILSKLQSKSSRFIGTSLIKWNDEGKLKLNKKGHKDYNVINVICATMYQASYANYGTWYRQQTQEIKDKVIYKPRNIFEFVCPYTMVITECCGKQYKFCRFFTWYALYFYNFAHNPLLTGPIDFSNLPTIIDDINFTTDVNELVQLLQDNNITSFNEGYQLLANLGNDNLKLYLFMTFISIYAGSLVSNLYILPGSLSSYNDLKSNSQYAFFCYNMNDDKNELINLADPNHSNRHNNALFTKLNKKMNDSIRTHKMNEFLYLVDKSTLLKWSLIIKTIGSNISIYTQDQISIFQSILGSNTEDVRFTKHSLNKIFNDFIGNNNL
jgi:arylsulfatase A-like enzyme